MTKSIDREFEDLHFDCEIDLEGMGAAIALQQKLGAMTLPIRLTDIVDARFSPCVFSDRTDTPKDLDSAQASGQE